MRRRRYLTKDISENEDIEYVPTQVFAEYFRIVGKLNGIKYDSSKSKKRNCFVLFYNLEDCVETDKKFSGLFKPKMEYIDAKKEALKVD